MPEMKLSPSSGRQAIQGEISNYIEYCMKEAVPEGTKVDNKQAWCSAKAYSIARQKTGKSIGKEA